MIQKLQNNTFSRFMQFRDELRKPCLSHFSKDLEKMVKNDKIINLLAQYFSVAGLYSSILTEDLALSSPFHSNTLRPLLTF